MNASTMNRDEFFSRTKHSLAVAANRILMHRSRRVVVLLCGIVLLSIADLLITLTHLQSFGMLEVNPIVVYLVQNFQSALGLTLFKLATVGLCVGLLFKARHSLPGEIGAWLAVAILTYMSVQWHGYTKLMSSPIEINLVRSGSMSDDWLMLPGADESITPRQPSRRMTANAPS